MHVYTLCKVDSEGQAASLAFTSHPRPRAACCCSRASSAGLGEEVHTADSSTLLPASKERQSKARPHSEPAAAALVAVPRLTQWPQPHAGQWRNMCVSICTNPAGVGGRKHWEHTGCAVREKPPEPKVRPAQVRSS